MNDKLATIQRIKAVNPHSNADNLAVADILGWKVIVKKSEFNIDDLCIYISIDTILPDNPEFEFLRNKNFRIKPIRLRGIESAGIAFPISILSNFGYDMKGPIYEGLDVTEILNVVHYEKPIPAELAGQSHGTLPGFLIMTDELSLRNYPDAIPEMYGRPYYITRKDDGCLDKNTSIITEDGIKSIESIHLEKYRGKCLSYNIYTDDCEYDNITNSLISENDSEWYEITLENGIEIKITGDHRVWIPLLQCYRKVKDLKESDEFLMEI